MNRTYRFARGLARVALDVYYRDVEVHGVETTPEAGPLLLLANHHNGMVDPALVVATSPRPVRFLAKAPLFGIPVLGTLMRGLDCVPVHRRQDPGYDKAKNEAVYEAVGDALARGGAVGIFPEGKSHTDPWLAEFKHGAARMALEAERAQDFALGLRVQLIGIHFERTRLFRGKALVTYAPPMTLEGFRERYEEDARAAVEALTGELHERLRTMVLEAENDELVRMADLVERLGVLEEGDAGARRDLKSRFDRKKLLLDTYARLERIHPEETERLVRRLRRYQGTLRLFGVRDGHLEEDHTWSRSLGRALRHTALLLLGAPFFVLGFALNAIPYWMVLYGVVLQAKNSDVRASSGLLVGAVVFPLWYLQLTWVAWYSALTWPVWLPVIALGPISGLVTIAWLERRRELGREAVALWMAVRLPGMRRRLRALRGEVLGALERLARLAR